MSIADTKYIVTGAAGFIGSAVVWVSSFVRAALPSTVVLLLIARLSASI